VSARSRRREIVSLSGPGRMAALPYHAVALRSSLFRICLNMGLGGHGGGLSPQREIFV
jgi:hypothetical protein